MMDTLRRVLMLQAVVLAIYGLPSLLFPIGTQVMTGQAPAPEPYFLRVIGIAFVILAWVEARLAADPARYERLTLPYAVLPAFFFVTIALQLTTTGFAGASWYWWINLVVTATLAAGVFAARRRARQ